MVKIRLKRMGATKRPYYRVVVADSRSPRDGRFIEEIGTYDPLPDPAVVHIDVDKVRDWMRRGAQPSEPARSLLEQQGILPRRARSAAPAAAVGEDPAAAEGGVATAAAPAADPDAADGEAEAARNEETAAEARAVDGGSE